ncbi:MAG: ExbD/TolR family protein [Planctomycetota bacterium]|jgi:biopolymer transport protein ExbD
MKRKSQDQNASKMDMTPMIDVVFQLIIFFMLVTDLTQQDLAELKLPMAQMAQKDETEEGRMVINIKKDGTIEIKRVPYATLDDPNTVVAMRTFLSNEVLKGDKEPDGTSERALLIRADEFTEFKHVQKLMRLCGENGIRIYKIHLAAAEPPGNQ